MLAAGSAAPGAQAASSADPPTTALTFRKSRRLTFSVERLLDDIFSPLLVAQNKSFEQGCSNQTRNFQSIFTSNS
jgi:hypothetical protein